MIAARRGALLTDPAAKGRVRAITMRASVICCYPLDCRPLLVKHRVRDWGRVLHLRPRVRGPPPLPPGPVPQPGPDIRIPVRWSLRGNSPNILIVCLPGDLCCQRRCTPESRCGHDTFGCETDQVSRRILNMIIDM